MIQPIRFQCPVCCKECIQQQTFSIGKCQHYFCRDCCISHINAKLNAFEQVKCLTTNCPEKLTKLSKIYSLLPLETQRKFLKHKQFMTLQSNKNLRACKKDQCLGLINIKKVMQNQKQKNFQCDQCGQKHCIRCLELYHGESEPCKIVSQHEKKRQDKFMRALNFRRCPSCSIWVQKNGGCQYLVCKCKTQFCFNCGADFDNDPCRKFLLLQSEMDIRKKSKITYLFRQPQSLMGYLCLLPATLLKIVLLILFTILSGVSFMVIVFGFLIPLIYLVAPAGLIVGIGQMQATKKHALLLRILTVLFYPLIGLGTALFVFGIFVSYPILRNIINSHLFDEIDRFMNQVSLVYLKVFNMILSI